MPAAIKMTAVVRAMYGLYLGLAIISAYIIINSIKAASFIKYRYP